MIKCHTVESTIGKNLIVEEIIYFPDSVFIPHGYSRHGGDELRGQYVLQFLAHFIRKDVHLLDAITLAYRSALSIRAEIEYNGDVDIYEELPQHRRTPHDVDTTK